MTGNILAEIRDEMTAQVLQWGGEHHDDEHGPRDWSAFITKQLGLALKHFEDDDSAAYRSRLIKISALCISAVKSHDRCMGSK